MAIKLVREGSTCVGKNQEIYWIWPGKVAVGFNQVPNYRGIEIFRAKKDDRYECGYSFAFSHGYPIVDEDDPLELHRNLCTNGTRHERHFPGIQTYLEQFSFNTAARVNTLMKQEAKDRLKQAFSADVEG